MDFGPEVEVTEGQNPAKKGASREAGSMTTPAVQGLESPNNYSVKVILQEIPADDPGRSLLVAYETLAVQSGDFDHTTQDREFESLQASHERSTQRQEGTENCLVEARETSPQGDLPAEELITSSPEVFLGSNDPRFDGAAGASSCVHPHTQRSELIDDREVSHGPLRILGVKPLKEFRGVGRRIL